MFRSSVRATRGELLVEVIVALGIFFVAMLAVSNVLVRSLQTQQISQQFILATNLAREGLEAVRNIRDTNWMRYPGDPANCWNNAATDECDGVLIASGAHVLTIDDEYQWSLSAQTDDVDINAGATSNAPYRLYLDAQGLYVDSGSDAELTPFHRAITIEYFKDDMQDISGSSPEDANIMRVHCTVWWQDSKRIQSATLSTIITNYIAATQ